MKKTTLVVDGYNAINAIPEVRKLLKDSLLSARSRIIMLASEYARSSGYITDFCVVFDGQDRYRYLERMYVPQDAKHTFSKSGEGDDKILETVRNFSEKGKVVVASNDNYVRNNSRSYGAAIIDSEELGGKKKKKMPADKDTKSDDKALAKDIKDKITREYMEELGL
jgi:uncharacterized protein